MVKIDLKIFLLLLFSCACFGIKAEAAEDSSVPASAKVYSELSDNSDIAANLIAGNLFEVLEAVSDGSGRIWYQVRTDFGVEGYVKADELDRLLMETQAMQQEAAENVENMQPEGADENVLDNDSLDNAAEDGDVLDNASLDNDALDNAAADENALDNAQGAVIEGRLITLDSVNLRSMPSTESEILTRINRNVELSYYQRYQNDIGEGWYQVDYNGMTGYVIESAAMVLQLQQEEQQEADNSEADVLDEETLQEESSVLEEIQSDTSSIGSHQAEFEVNEGTDVPKKHKHGGVDIMLVILIIGGILCIAAIVIFLKKILGLLRK